MSQKFRSSTGHFSVNKECGECEEEDSVGNECVCAGVRGEREGLRGDRRLSMRVCV